MFEWFLTFWPESWHGFWAYVTGGAHQAFYRSFLLIISATVIGSFLALIFGLIGASLARANNKLARSLGWIYINMVRGIPDVLFFIFFPLAFVVLIKIVRTWLLCDPGTLIFDGINFAGCAASDFFQNGSGILGWLSVKVPFLNGLWNWVGENFRFVFYFAAACMSIGIIFGAFAANVIRGALNSIPYGQIEAAQAYGMSQRRIFWRIQFPQMWVYAWGGLTNIWMLVIKATSLMSLLGIQDAVWWVTNRLGPPQNRSFVGYVHGDWTLQYFTLLALFYLAFTYVSETGFARAKQRLTRGMGVV